MKRNPVAASVIVACAMLVSGVATAQSTSTETTPGAKQGSAPGQKATRTLQTIVVTGTRAFGRTAVTSLSPIDILTPAELTATGAPNLSGALRLLLPSFYSAMQSLTDAAVGVQPAALRGLSPNETLVLINGKLQHHSAVALGSGADETGSGFGGSPIDLNAIPINAIQRIEVLRDGAAAQYGSSAIAGVINIILKGGSSEQGSAYTTYGKYDKDGTTIKSGADGGFALGNRGWIHLAADYLHQDYANRAGPDGRDPGDPRHDTVDMIVGLPKERQKQFAMNMQYDFGENATFYAFGVYNKRNAQNAGAYRMVTGYEASNPGIVSIFPAGFLPFENQTILDSNTVVGIRGLIGAWHYDVSANVGISHWKLNTSNTVNYSLGANSPTQFYIGTLTYQDNVFNADLRRDFDMHWGYPLTVAWGFEYQGEKFREKAGDPDSYFGSGAQVFPGLQAADALSKTRGTEALYVDLETQFSDKFSASGTGRYVHNSQFGSDSVGKLAARYAFTNTFAVRATASSGFASPTMQEQWYQTTGNSFLSNPSGPPTLTTTDLLASTSPIAASLGAQPLKPETSVGYTLGVVYTPKVGPYITIDGYQITIENRILPSGVLSGSAVSDYLASIGFPFINGVSFYTNAVTTRTRGIDAIATWPIALASSELHLTLAGNWNKTELLSIAPNPPQAALHGLTIPIVDRAVIGSLTDGTPRSNASLSAVWSKGPWTVNGRATRFGEWTVRNKYSAASDQSFGPNVLLDASVSYQLHKWTFTVGGQNVTNRYPGRNNKATNFAGVIQYPITSPFGYVGAFWYGTLRYSW